jgi:TusA-related sulfurtransferase
MGSMRERGRSIDGRKKTGTSAVDMDLRGVACPLSWARAKVRLESLERGDRLTVLLDDAKGVRDIPRAAEAEGYAVAEPVPDGTAWRLTIVV